MFAQAHALTKKTIKAGDNYAATFALCLRKVYADRPIVEIFDHSRSTRPNAEIVFNTYDQAREFIKVLPAFTCAQIRRGKAGGVSASNYPNSYMPNEKDASWAFDTKQTDWLALMPQHICQGSTFSHQLIKG